MPMSIEFSPTPELRSISIGSLPLESGESIEDCCITWVEHGLTDPDAPVALALCAIGSTHQRMEFLIGPGLPLDTSRLRIIAVNALGNGLSTSPSNSVRQPGHAFPVFSIRDMVASQARLLDELGIERLDVVAGASMGGMQALQWGVSHPLRMERIVALSPLARTPGWSATINEAARRALHPFVAPGIWSAQKSSATTWESWLLIMQLLAVTTPDRVDSEIPDHNALKHWLGRRAEEWARRGFDPLDWFYQSLAYDAHDVGKTPGQWGDTATALASIQARTLMLSARPDLYNPTERAAWAAKQIRGCVYAEIKSDWGHLTFSAADAGNAPLLRHHISQFLWASEDRSLS